MRHATSLLAAILIAATFGCGGGDKTPPKAPPGTDTNTDPPVIDYNPDADGKKGGDEKKGADEGKDADADAMLGGE